MYGSYCVLVVVGMAVVRGSPHKALPNIVIMIADDLGMGDVGCFGNTTLRTPHIDSIASAGVKLTHHLAAASVCTPSRAAILTGRYPIRMGMVPTGLFRVNIFTSSISGLPANEVTFAELAKEKNYSTALIGKWHLGLHSEDFSSDFAYHPLNQGFDYFYGVPLTNLKDFGDDGQRVVITEVPLYNQINVGVGLATVFFFVFLARRKFLGMRMSMLLCLLSITILLSQWWIFTNMKLLNSILMRNHQLIEQPIKLPGLSDRLVKEGTDFLNKRKNDSRPFLLVMSWIQVHTALHATRTKGVSVHGPYGDEVEELDWSVGEILEALRRLGLTDNTLVYFTSDNGAHIEEQSVKGVREGGYNAIYRGGKFQGGMEGGIRVPTVAMWPGVIQPDTQIDVPTSQMDVAPTLAEIIGVSMPQDRIIDGASMLPLLSKQTVVPPHEFMFHYCGSALHAVRYTPKQGGVVDVWKAHFMTPNWVPGTQGCVYRCRCYDNKVTVHNPPLLYNVGRDPSESELCTADRPCHPLKTKQQHDGIIEAIAMATRQHSESLDRSVPSQYSWYRVLPRPWLQMCCNFPSCQCEES